MGRDFCNGNGFGRISFAGFFPKGASRQGWQIHRIRERRKGREPAAADDRVTRFLPENHGGDAKSIREGIWFGDNQRWGVFAEQIDGTCLNQRIGGPCDDLLSGDSARFLGWEAWIRLPELDRICLEKGRSHHRGQPANWRKGGVRRHPVRQGIVDKRILGRRARGVDRGVVEKDHVKRKK